MNRQDKLSTKTGTKSRDRKNPASVANAPFPGQHTCTPCLIYEKIVINTETVELRIRRKPRFIPGQVVAITLPGFEQTRMYSICSGTEDDHMAIVFDIKPGGYLTPRLAGLHEGDTILVSAPFGEFTCEEDKAFWIAAGTGIAPFRSMMRSGKAPGKILLHGGRQKGSFLYNQEFSAVSGLIYIPCSSLLKEKDFFPGRVTDFVQTSDTITADYNYYLCGSAEMVTDVRNLLITRNIPHTQVIAEIYF